MPRDYSHLSKEQLIALLQARDERRLGLVWERDPALIGPDSAAHDDFVALEPDSTLHHGDGPYPHLVIEGDNLDALRYLRMTHAGRVDCIYIDPPYNTGNRDFVYNDRFVNPDDQWRHSRWLEFMWQRLTLARDLLAEHGVIFVSIDDHEIFHLGLLMNQVFGEQNFVANCIWQKVFAPKNTAKHFSDDHEYVLVYANNGTAWRPNLLPRSEEAESRYKNPDKDPRGPWTSGDIQARNFYSEGTYPIQCPGGRVIQGPGEGMFWRYSKTKFAELDRENRIWWGKDGNGMPRVKRFRSEVMGGQIPQTLWAHVAVGHTQEAKKELLQVIGGGGGWKIDFFHPQTRSSDRAHPAHRHAA